MAGDDPHDGEATTENWRDSDTHLVVQQPEGYFCTLSMLARVPLPPSKVFQILTDPDNARIFQAIKANLSRRVVWNDGNGKQLVEVEQECRWRFLIFRGTFVNKMLVEEDKNNHSICVRLAQPGFMRRFQGKWVIKPFNQDSIDHLVNHKQQAQQHHGLLPSLHDLQSRIAPREAQTSLVQLEHSILPSFVPPPPTDRLLKRIAGKQLIVIMNDLRKEADRLNQGKLAGRLEEVDGGSEETGAGEKDLQALDAHVRKL